MMIRAGNRFAAWSDQSEEGMMEDVPPGEVGEEQISSESDTEHQWDVRCGS